MYVLDKRFADGIGMDLCIMLNAFTPGVPCIFYTSNAYEIHRQEAFTGHAMPLFPSPTSTRLSTWFTNCCLSGMRRSLVEPADP